VLHLAGSTSLRPMRVTKVRIQACKSLRKISCSLRALACLPAFLCWTVVVTCAHRPSTRAGHRPWDRAATTAQSGPGHNPRGRGETPPELWPGLDARSADAGQLSGGMLVPAGVTTAATLALLRTPVARCSNPGPPWVWPSARRPAALSGSLVRVTAPGETDSRGRNELRGRRLSSDAAKLDRWWVIRAM
jgi:hypothetical protein